MQVPQKQHVSFHHRYRTSETRRQLFVVCLVILLLVISISSMKSDFDSDLGQVRRDLSEALVQLNVSSTLFREGLAAKQSATAANTTREFEGVQKRLDHMQKQLLPKISDKQLVTIFGNRNRLPFSCSYCRKRKKGLIEL